jgi:uncharacterized protein YdhG (YjbR/CyaY superfamily)
MTDPSPATVEIDARLAALPAEQRTVLQALREAIAAAAPHAVEAISYGAPAFRYRGRPLVAYAAYKAHCSFFPMSPGLIVAHREELVGFTVAKGTIQFTQQDPLPADLVQRIVRERLAEIDAR